MSDLSRLRERLVRIERAGKRLKGELAELRDELSFDGAQLTRTQERRIKRLEAEIDDQRKLWAECWDRVRAEERRLLERPDAFLRFT